MVVTATSLGPRGSDEGDQRVVFRGVSWSQFETLLGIRGDSSVPRMSYLRGVVELMSPSGDHERIKKILARLVEAFAEERGIPLNGFGSWTLRDRIAERGAEPDECYVLGATDQAEVPDLVIEVRWTRGGLDKLEIYRGLGVRELWIWQDGAIGVFVLSGGRYATASSSLLLPELDLVGLSRFLEMDDQTEAVRTFRALVRNGPAL